MSNLSRREEVLDNLEWSPVVDTELCVKVTLCWSQDGNSEELVAKCDSLDEDLGEPGRRIFLLILYSHDVILLPCHDIAKGTSKVKLCLFFLVQTFEQFIMVRFRA